MAIKRAKQRGIFAIEGEWDSDLRRGIDFKPVLELISKLSKVTLDELMMALQDRCKNRIIFFDSCSTMRIDGRRLQTFLRRNHAVAICSYQEYIDMLRSAAFNLLAFDAIMRMSRSLTIQGAKAAKTLIERSD